MASIQDCKPEPALQVELRRCLGDGVGGEEKMEGEGLERRRQKKSFGAPAADDVFPGFSPCWIGCSGQPRAEKGEPQAWRILLHFRLVTLAVPPYSPSPRLLRSYTSRLGRQLPWQRPETGTNTPDSLVRRGGVGALRLRCWMRLDLRHRYVSISNRVR